MSRTGMTAVVPAAGVGKRMGSTVPKQYLKLAGKTVLEHSLARLLAHDAIERVVVAVSPEDQWFASLPLAEDPRVLRVDGGRERADSVLNALAVVTSERVLVHDAARPCLAYGDLDALLAAAQQPQGAILACRVRDTMKRGNGRGAIAESVPRDELWHALTPQCFVTEELRRALADALANGLAVTDEASAMELAGVHPLLVEGRADNIKITRPEDLALAGFFLQQLKENNE
ncbi:2-C-methyl-D-erythritol 4-phosphate cytidylyltransferase [Oceanimonas sp. GK1]|uniref:2-C-methyl-D-erythritol 4-phosphate cytidylyltransferase n=1 Tax=Oceanimonas sp. (strain GK1 / IBRC-M 10197) TaxID=511062 RepID=UPI000249527D|nr:2-C-methyl-D-erythritol 4-phosphate cytidylyltransferase [Oceanimonas sp. GK1]AEY02778.1 2-C-methyl-D-erythritol 4-phosphate cytidylyltransferase [Oceanimonas sp. GK1]